MTLNDLMTAVSVTTTSLDLVVKTLIPIQTRNQNLCVLICFCTTYLQLIQHLKGRLGRCIPEACEVNRWGAGGVNTTQTTDVRSVRPELLGHEEPKPRPSISYIRDQKNEPKSNPKMLRRI